MIKVRDKKQRHFTSYLETPFVLDINIENFEDHGIMTGWRLFSSSESYEGKNKKDFLDTLNTITQKYELKNHDGAVEWEDRIIIFVDDIRKIIGFFDVDECFPEEASNPLYVTLGFFEFRSYEVWQEKLSCDKALEMLTMVYNDFFIPDKYFYLTPNQRIRKRISKLTKKYKETTAAEIYPQTMDDLDVVRKAIFGGLCFCSCPGVAYDDDMIEVDIKSAYIYTLFIEKHTMSKSKEVNPSTWRSYIDNGTKGSIGIYHIKYTTVHTAVSCFKDENGDHFPVGEDIEVDAFMCSTDIATLLAMDKVYVKKVECLYLIEYKMGRLGKAMRDVLLEEYLKKASIDEKTDPYRYKAQKVTLNGVAGNCQRLPAAGDKKAFLAARKNPSIAPTWGVWTTAYLRQLIITLAQQLKGWRYTDTDSIYCRDTYENRKKIEETNEIIREHVREFCNELGYDFEKLKDLGQFEIKAEIDKFGAFSAKHYCYHTKDDHFEVKAAGCIKEEMNLSVDTVFAKDKDGDIYLTLHHLPVGHRKNVHTDNGYYITYDNELETMIYGIIANKMK